MSKTSSEDNFVAYIAAAVVVTLLSISLLTWNHVRSSSQSASQIAYARFGPFQVETQSFSLKASLVVQTSNADAGWADRNRNSLNVIFRKVLADTDANVIKAPNGLQILQEALKKGCNSTMNTNAVQAVLLTDFSFQAHDS